MAPEHCEDFENAHVYCKSFTAKLSSSMHWYINSIFFFFFFFQTKYEYVSLLLVSIGTLTNMSILLSMNESGAYCSKVFSSVYVSLVQIVAIKYTYVHVLVLRLLGLFFIS